MGFFWLLLGHVLGEFNIRELISNRSKRMNLVRIMIHSFIYMAVMLFFISVYGSFIHILGFSILFFMTHLMLESIIYCLSHSMDAYKKSKWELYFFLFTQIIYIGLLIAVWYRLPNVNEMGSQLVEWVNAHDVERIVVIVLTYAFVLSPTAHLIKLVLSFYFPSEELGAQNLANTGALIGKLERVIILTLGLMQLYTSIAFVFTAKSLARFKQLEDRQFAEKYLIGTLLSFWVAIMCLVFLKEMG
jgi:Protein of unknown function (DUF3307)